MTDEPQEVETEETADAGAVHCRHCGWKHDMPAELMKDSDWLCQHCGRYQEAVLCPTCHQVARVSMLPEDAVPARHAPVNRRAK